MATKMKKLKVEMSTTQEPLEIDYVDNELFPEDEEIKIVVGKVLAANWLKFFLTEHFIFMTNEIFLIISNVS